MIIGTYIMYTAFIMLQNWRPKTRRQLLNYIGNMDESIGEINIVSLDEASDSSTTLNSIEEIPSPKLIGPDVECPWLVGQLAWARVGNFPFWPCMVTVDPTSRIYYKLRGKFLKFVHISLI